MAKIDAIVPISKVTNSNRISYTSNEVCLNREKSCTSENTTPTSKSNYSIENASIDKNII
jgi:hypothetical protein